MGTIQSDELAAYVDAYRIRMVELEIARRYHQDDESPMKCPTHLSVGAEHLAVAVARSMPAGTKAYSTHRSHAHYLAWGGDLRRMIAELYGRKTGCAGGWGGSMHLVDESVGFMGTSAIVGSSLSYAVGSAFAAKLEGSDRWTVAFVGDAVPETGQFWESLNFAALKRLNLVIVIEDNDLATATPKRERQAMIESNGTTMVDVLPHWSDNYLPHVVNANTYESIVYHLSKAIKDHRWDSRPVIIRSIVDRYFEHVGPNTDDWRTAPVVWGAGDPILKMRDAVTGELAAKGQRVHDEIRDEINTAFDQAASDPWPDDLPMLFYGGRK